jgi:spermidine synthase
MGLFLLFGACSLLAQALLLREVSQVFGAHELSLAAALAFWLLWSAAGVLLGGRAGGEKSFLSRALVFALVAPFNLLLARLAPGLLPAIGQPGLFTLLAGSALLCLPAALANGWAAGAALRGRPAFFYAAEAAGAAAAGLFTIYYYRSFPGLEAVAALAVPALIFAAAWAGERPFRVWRAGAAAGAALALGLCIRSAPQLWTLKPPAFPPLLVIQTEGSRLALTKHGDFSFYEDGRLLHAPEDTAPEELVHIPLLAVKKPGKVLLHGGGAFFALPEVLKHKPESVEIAEPDRFKAAALAEKTGADHGKYSLLPADPRALQDRNGAYSVIFNAGSAPENAAQNRFYTTEYFRKAADLLAPGGLLVFQLPFAENYVPPVKAFAAASVLASARAVFPAVEIIPGARLTVLASAKPVSLDPQALGAQYSRRKIKAKAVVPASIPFMLHPYRRAWAAGELAKVRKPPRNTDLNPLAYFQFWRAWLSMVLSPSALLGLAALALGGLYAAFRLKDSLKFTPEERTGEAFLMGFWGLAFETAALLAFQAETGRLNPELGAMFALFMAGAGAGAWAARRCAPKHILLLEAAAAALALGAALRPELAQTAWGARCLILGGGLISGAFFAAAAGKTGAEVYSWDLIGGAAGGFAAAAFAAPLAGVTGTLYLSGIAALGALAGGLSAARRKAAPGAGAAATGSAAL